MCEKHKSCAIIGHRKIEITEDLKSRIFDTVCGLVENKGVKRFLFGSKSDFNTLCYEIILCAKSRYSFIESVVYTCKNEAFIDNASKEEIEIAYKTVGVKDRILSFDKEVEFRDKYVSGKSAYIQRNYAMIDDSDYCLFYYNSNYHPQNSTGKTTNSGTALSYQHALKNSKIIINVCDE
ncbi:MAG: hypothetical protein E7353_06170 [Clostridiales bacterium]|nr:hypothetical protein [Clostridiales bacterium]